jgi:sortase A
MNNSRRRTGIALLCAGIIALILTYAAIALIVLDDYRAGRASELTARILSEQILQNKQERAGDYNYFYENMPQLLEIDGEFYIGTIIIPSLGLELPVNNDWSDEKLDGSPCRYSGNIAETLVISAHNYAGHFGRIYSLAAGDKIIITDAAGSEHLYGVELVYILHETEIDAMINTRYDLTLFTCTLDSRHRLTVRCVKIDPENPENPENIEDSGEPE